jgi:hypothetical protein
MKRKIMISALYALIIMLWISILGLIFIPLLYLESFSQSPLNIWHEEKSLTRLEELLNMGPRGILADLWGEIKFKFRHEFALIKVQEQKLYAQTTKHGFQVLKDGTWQEIFVKGVNIGAALPGRWFIEFPRNEQVYLDWLEKIGQMQANSIRVYTLLPPEFYRALLYYNIKHPEAPLWLFQEIWPEENPEGENYLNPSYVEEYFQEIKYDVDAIHGKANIPERKGRAYGVYDSDVSPYVLGYLVGRELEPDEVIKTNQNNPGVSYIGEYLSSDQGAAPTEAWLAMNCDYVLHYEESTYGTQHPVAIVSWPTLDVQEHDSEWNASGLKSLEYNDKVSVNINHISTGNKLQAGFFGAYHIYPNYPDFMNNESKYDNYRDEEGRFRYGGYLKEFIENHTKYPALVAEFGLSTGMGNAHFSPDGYHHGGLTEEEQGQGIVRMMKAIRREGYAGGLIFEWLDEWAKKTWITEPFMIPYERHVLWHNALDPEQNYGLYAMESLKEQSEEYIQNGSGVIRQISLTHDSTFMYLDVELNRLPDFSREKILIGLDTYDRARGEFRFAPDLNATAPGGLEFLVDLSGAQNAQILVNPGYNIAKGKYSSVTSFKGEFEEIRPLINQERITKDGRKIAAVYQDGSRLYYGDFAENTHNHWYIEGTTVHIRIPWGKLNVTDPSSLRVLDDSRKFSVLSRDQLQTVETTGILISTLFVDSEKHAIVDTLGTAEPYLWKGWDYPQYSARLKKSYDIIKDFFSTLP